MISVIIPAYNCQDTLAKAVRSLLAQSYQDFEIIIINDGSDDDTEEVAKALARLDGRIRLFTVSNAGVSAARNRGMQSAKGEYICFVDSDDYVDGEYLSSLAAGISDGVMPCTGFAINEEDHPRTADLPGGEYTVAESLFNDYLCGILRQTVYHSVWNKLFSADVIRENALEFSERLAVGEDLLFVLRYLCFCRKIRFDNIPAYHYMIRQTSTMRSARRSLLEDYDRLLGELKALSYRGKTAGDVTLGCWALESMSYVMLCRYVTSMRYREFCGYCGKVFSSELYRYAVSCDMKCSFKRGAFRFALRRKNKLLLYLILKAAVR